MNFFRSMEIDPTCKFSPPQSRSGGISFYGFSAPRRFHATKTQSRHRESFAHCVAQKSHRFVIQGYEELRWNYCDGLVVCDAGEVKTGG
jgi:hypothetical protein